MNLRCAVVCPIATGGGVTEAFITSLAMLRAGGVTPIAVVPANFFFLERLASQGYEIIPIGGLERGGTFNQLLQAFAIARAARRSRADLLLLNNGRHVSALRRLLPKTPLIAHYHGGKVRRFLGADRVITSNVEQMRFLADVGYPAAQAVVLDYALPIDALPPYEARARSAGPPVVGTLRLLEPAKGVDVLIDAIGLLAARGRRIRTRIGSTGSQEKFLKARVRELGICDIVEFAGWIDDKQAFYDSLDIYVLPSRSEEWGIGIVEAYAERLPLIATACLGPKRIVKSGETGLLVPIADPSAMADALEKLLADPALCERLARAGYAHCAENYLFPRIAALFVTELLKARPVNS